MLNGIGTNGPASLADRAAVTWGGETSGKGKGEGKGDCGKGGDDKSKLVNKCFICNSPDIIILQRIATTRSRKLPPPPRKRRKSCNGRLTRRRKRNS